MSSASPEHLDREAVAFVPQPDDQLAHVRHGGVRDPDQARLYDEWLATLRSDFGHRILPVDVAVAEEWGHLNAVDLLPVIDGLLAATAKVRGWTLVTRNTRDVQRTGVQLLDPFAAAG